MITARPERARPGTRDPSRTSAERARRVSEDLLYFFSCQLHGRDLPPRKILKAILLLRSVSLVLAQRFTRSAASQRDTSDIRPCCIACSRSASSPTPTQSRRGVALALEHELVLKRRNTPAVRQSFVKTMEAPQLVTQVRQSREICFRHSAPASRQASGVNRQRALHFICFPA
jgi:hypothetical protein